MLRAGEPAFRIERSRITIMIQSKSKFAGWVLSGLLAAFLCLASASGKFFDFPDKEVMFAKLGWATDVMFYVGIVEVTIAILFLIPRFAFIAAILLSAYLGGATATHVRVDEPFFAPIVIGVIVWVALGLRDPRVFNLAFQSSAAASNELAAQASADPLTNQITPQNRTTPI